MEDTAAWVPAACNYCGQPVKAKGRRFCSLSCRSRGSAKVDAPAHYLTQRIAKPTGELGCWLWTGARYTKGYGVACHRSKRQAAHRLSYQLHYGPIPEGYQVCHKCDNPPCVNPLHLFLGTATDNMRDMAAKGRDGAHTKPEKVRRGSEAGQARLTDAQVIEIRARYDAGEIGMYQLSRQYGISKSQAGRIVRREAWTHLATATN